ncbi:major facilitator superfamily domain-containing protein [Xylaria sp. FL0043]|nr:major facilitator superfamily domain-containing protein [Xylaria sp. FL0043]
MYEATAIPQITSDCSSLHDMDWYGSSYVLAQMSLLPTPYIALLLIFELGFVACAVATNSTTLSVGRAIAGLGAAGLLSGVTVILFYCVALKQRAFLLSIILGVYSFWRSWPSIDLVYSEKPPPPAKAGLSQMQNIRQMDITGAVLFIGPLTSLLLALQRGGIIYSWSGTKGFGNLIGFVLILIVFLVSQKRDRTNCTIPLHIFRSRTVSIVTQTYYWPLYFQTVNGTNARDSGIFTLPLAISNTLATRAAGWLTFKIRYYTLFIWISAPLLATEGAVRVVLGKSDVPTGCVMVIFFQGLGGVLATNGVESTAVASAGARDFRNVILVELTELVIEAFGSALRNVFLVTLATPLTSLIINTAMKWRRLPQNRKVEDTERNAPPAPQI